jgi:hypothetical protein
MYTTEGSEYLRNSVEFGTTATEEFDRYDWTFIFRKSTRVKDSDTHATLWADDAISVSSFKQSILS